MMHVCLDSHNFAFTRNNSCTNFDRLGAHVSNKMRYEVLFYRSFATDVIAAMLDDH